MKIKLIISNVIFLLCFNAVNAQGLKFGGKLSVGFGGMDNGGSLQDYYNFKTVKDQDVTEYQFNYSSGVSINFGGVVSYGFNEMFSLGSGLEFQKTSNDIDINRKKITDKTDGSFKRNESTTKISITSLIIPLTVKARFGESTYKPFLEGGFSLEIRMGKTIESEETKTKVDVTKGETTVTNYAFTDKDLDGLNGTTLNFIIGGGVDYEISEEMTLFFSLRYSTNIGNSELWNKSISSNSANIGDINDVFGLSEQANIRSDGFIIDDWKSSLFSISVGVMF